MNYPYHLDATLYAKYLRQFSENHGTQRIEGKINKIMDSLSDIFVITFITKVHQLGQKSYF